MKIFNKEDGVEVVYVQMNDLAMLTHYEDEIPASIFLQVFTDITIIDDRNRWEFQRFVDPDTIEFFKKADWVVDYKFYRHMKEDEIMGHGQVMADELNAVANEYNSYTEEERKDHQDLRMRHELLEFKFYSIREILWLKQGHRVMPIPVVPDCDGFTVNGDDDDFPYVANQGLNPTQMLLSRKDGKPLDSEEEVPIGFVQSAESLLMIENTEKNEFFGEFERIREFSEDSKYFVTTLRIITPEEKEKKEQSKTTANSQERMTLSKKVKDAWNRIRECLKR